MRSSRQRRREDEEAARPAARTARAPDTTSEVLALQQSAGNHAVTRALATARLDRDTKAPAKPQPPPQKEEPRKGAVYKMDVKEVGVFDLLSFQFSQPSRPRGRDDPGSGGGGGTKRGPAEISVTMVTSKGSVKLLDAAAKGKRLELVVIEVTGSDGATMTITLKGVYVSSYLSGGGGGGERVESFGLSSEETEITLPPPSRDRGGYDTEGWLIP